MKNRMMNAIMGIGGEEDEWRDSFFRGGSSMDIKSRGVCLMDAWY